MNNLTINTLAGEINALNGQLIESVKSTLAIAVQIGEKLNQVKAELPHGEFGKWLEVNCTVSQQHANKFMKLAKENPDFLNYAYTRNLGIDVAYQLLSAPDEVKEQVTEKLAHGETVTQSEIKRLKQEAEELRVDNEDTIHNPGIAWPVMIRVRLGEMRKVIRSFNHVHDAMDKSNPSDEHIKKIVFLIVESMHRLNELKETIGEYDGSDQRFFKLALAAYHREFAFLNEPWLKPIQEQYAHSTTYRRIEGAHWQA